MTRRLVRVPADLSGTGACASFVLRRTARAVTRCYDDALRPAGLRSTQFTILAAVAKRQPLPVGELARLVAMDPSTTSRNLAPLVADGLLRVTERGNARRKLVALTGRGARVLARAVPRWRRTQAQLVALLGKDDWSALSHQLDRLAEQIRARRKRPR